MTWQIVSESSAQTELFGALFARILEPPALIELVADVGGGKTTLVKGFARGLGVKEPISSPTFTLSREYEGDDEVFLHHYDLYRLAKPGLLADELAESINDDRVVTLIEWAQTVQGILPKDRLKIMLEPREINPDERSITVHYGSRLARHIKQLENEWNSR